MRIVLAFLVALVAATGAFAQDVRPDAGSSEAWQHDLATHNPCSEPSNPQVVNAGVDRCADALVKAEVQEIPGIRLDETAVPQDDPELLLSPDQQGLGSRAHVQGATSWAPKAVRPQKTLLPPLQQSSGEEFVVRLPQVNTSTGEETGEALPSEIAPLNPVRRRLARNRVQKRDATKHPHSHTSEQNPDPACRPLQLSPLECRLKLKEQKLSATNHFATSPAASARKATR